MKRIFNLTLVLSLILFSCEKSYPPVAQFSTDNAEPEVGQEIYFNNESQHGNNFEWDFGDGYISNDPNPVHIFTVTGIYEVKLTAYSKSGQSDMATMTIEVFMPTLLVIEVLEYFDQYPVPDASVYLYPDSNSWDEEKNLVAEGFTDIDGMVVFSHLDYQEYYVDVWEQHHNNYLLRDENVGFITTSELVPHKITWFVAWVDYFDTKGAARRESKYVVKKLERKIIDKEIPEGPAIENWQELYLRSIKVK